MSEEKERRTAPRILTDFSLVLFDDKGVELDGRAIAHDVSDKGFRVETQIAFEKGRPLRFRLTLGDGGEILGRARVVWTQNSELSRWAGVEFAGLSWADKRRLRRVTSPGAVDWEPILDKALVALGVLLLATVSWIASTDPVWSRVMTDLTPKIVALAVMAVALRVLLRRD